MAGSLSATLNDYRRQRRNRVLLLTLTTAAIFNVSAVTAALALDNLAGLSTGGRIFLLLCWLVINSVIAVVMILRLWRQRLTDRAAAVELEEAFDIRNNSLVNAVCFHADAGLSETLRRMFAVQADVVCRNIRITGVWGDPGLRRAVLAAVLLVVLSLVYFIPCSRYAANALMRYLRPWSQLASLNYVQFTVTPGDTVVVEGDELTIRAAAVRGGQMLHNLGIRLEGDGTPVLYSMAHVGGQEVFKLENITTPLSYVVCSGNESSRAFKIKVLPRPRFSKITIKAAPPPYTGLKPVVYGVESREINVPVGTTMTINALTPDGMSSGLRVSDGKENMVLPDSFVLMRDMMVDAFIIDQTGRRFDKAWTCTLKAVPDRLPQVIFLNRELNMEAGPGQVIPLYFEADDDYGVTSMQVVATVDGRRFVVKKFRFSASVPVKSREAFNLILDPAAFPVDSVVEVNVEVADSHSPVQVGVTKTPLTIHVVDLVRKLQDSLTEGRGDRMYELLFQALNRQQAARTWLAERQKRFNKVDGWRILSDQKNIDGLLVKAQAEADELVKNGCLQKKFPVKLATVRSSHTLPLASRIRELTSGRRKVNVPQEINGVMLAQTAVIEQLQQLLGGMAAAREQELARQERARENADDKASYDQLEQLMEKVYEFMKEQRQIISRTEAFDPKKTDDWSDKEEKILGDMAAREAEWAQFFKAAFNDLSKLMNQDFSNSAMADEFIEMYEELQKSGAALEKKHVEIATLAENTAMDSANAVAANLDRWLSDNKDYIKWNAEEDGNAPDVDLTDLPEELTDIIGDLVETEDEMSDDTQDSTNSFSYDSDEALGWGVSDGNINSMQAKGITGNVLPNDHEVGGRSGEGRSGKSSGQFVEKEAAGKGGRKTPTRLDQSPFEKGTVDDKSKDPTGGVSGGGKQSGVGDEGLSGITPDQDSDIKQRLSGNQGELKQRVSALLRRLHERNLPTGDLQEALQRIRMLDDSGSSGGADARRLRNETLAALRQAQAALDTAVRSEQEKVRINNRRSYTVKNQPEEKVPAEYDDYVGRYFKALAEE